MKLVKFKDIFGIVERIYTGHEHGCRCGCLGRYFDPGTTGFTRALNKIKKLNPTVKVVEANDDINAACAEVAEGVAICDGSLFVDLCLPNDRTITVYYSEGSIAVKNV